VFWCREHFARAANTRWRSMGRDAQPATRALTITGGLPSDRRLDALGDSLLKSDLLRSSERPMSMPRIR
jgi:hypothetical protein